MNTTTTFLTTGSHLSDTAISTPYNERNVFEKLLRKEAKLALVGLGYVGLPIALEFAKSFSVIGYDINDSRVQMMKIGIDPSDELVSSDFENKDIYFTSDAADVEMADVIVVAVPTPVGKAKQPNLAPLTSACKAVGAALRRGNIVVFESTVYPGCTDEVCVPLLEEVSGLKCNKDFWVGYSPERINPGDKVHTLTNITKIVSGSDAYAREELYKIYDHIIDAGIHVAPTMKVAEAAKIVENTQRDVNIGLMNELSTLFEALQINTHDVLQAAGTKWNFLNFYPGLVGGHCIGVDPYYLIHKGNSIGVDLDIISSCRATNDDMPSKVVSVIQKKLEKLGKSLDTSKVLVLGATFKENVSDLRNSKAAEMCQILDNNSKTLHIVDPLADEEQFENYYGLRLTAKIEEDYDVVVYAVNHNEFDTVDWEFVDRVSSSTKVVFDFKKLLGTQGGYSDNTEYVTL